LKPYGSLVAKRKAGLYYLQTYVPDLIHAFDLGIGGEKCPGGALKDKQASSDRLLGYEKETVDRGGQMGGEKGSGQIVSRIWGGGFLKREKRLAYIGILRGTTNSISFRSNGTLTKREREELTKQFGWEKKGRNKEDWGEAKTFIPRQTISRQDKFLHCGEVGKERILVERKGGAVEVESVGKWVTTYLMNQSQGQGFGRALFGWDAKGKAGELY